MSNTRIVPDDPKEMMRALFGDMQRLSGQLTALQEETRQQSEAMASKVGTMEGRIEAISDFCSAFPGLCQAEFGRIHESISPSQANASRLVSPGEVADLLLTHYRECTSEACRASIREQMAAAGFVVKEEGEALAAVPSEGGEHFPGNDRPVWESLGIPEKKYRQHTEYYNGMARKRGLL